MKLLGLLTLLLSTHAFSEYRVYQYMVKPKTQAFLVNDSGAKLVKSTLNPVSYIAYNGGAGAIDLTLMRSWMCPGNTGKKDFCAHSSQREVASE